MKLNLKLLLLVGLWSLAAALLFVVIVIESSNQSYSRVPWDEVIVFVFLVVILSVGTPATFMAIRSIPHVGWSRILTVLAIVSAVIGCFFGIDQAGSTVRGDDYFEVAAYTVGGPILVVWFLLAAKKTIEWILDGFGANSRN